MTDPAEASIPGYRYDVFVSYAHDNDHEGWVSRFKGKLTDYLTELLYNKAQIFWDAQSLRPNDDLNSTILEAVSQSAIMVVVVSEKYLMREWCERERETFLQNADERRVLIVRYDNVSFENFQQVLPQHLGIQFFDDAGQPLETRSKEFSKRMHTLRTAIVEELDKLREDVVASTPEQFEPAGHGSVSVSIDESEPLVFVAPVPPIGEMISRRDELTSFLKDCGIATVTPAHYFLMELGLPGKIAADLDYCDGFVQLLDADPFLPLDMLPSYMADSVERWFLTQARQHEHLPILRWRRDTPSADAGDFHYLAVEADVRPFEFARFCELVRDEVRIRHQARRAGAQRARTASLPLVVLRADLEDESLRTEVSRQLDALPVGPLEYIEAPPSMWDSLDDIASQIPAGGLLVLFRKSRAVLRRIQELRTFTTSDAACHWVLGFWNSPEDPTRAIRPRLRMNIHIIDDGDTVALSAFARELMQRGV